MGFFNKKQSESEPKTPRNPNNLVMFRVLAVGYLFYLCVSIVKLYLAGGPDAPSVTALVLGLAFLGGGAIFLGILSYKEWKRGKVEYDAYMADLRAEAEAKRAAEEEAQEADLLESAQEDTPEGTISREE